MTDTQQELPDGLGQLAELAAMPSDPTGLDTFARFTWQAKQVVRQWLTCISDGEDHPLFAVCEQVDDLALVHRDRFRFVQLKTRDKGSWSVAAMFERGLDAVVRAYAAARGNGNHAVSTFELWLEGPISERTETRAFVDVPRSASAEVRSRLVALGLSAEWVDDFLERLVVRPDQPTRASVDAIAMLEIGVLWPALSQPELLVLYERLLAAATTAQTAGGGQSWLIQAQLRAAQESGIVDLPGPGEPGAELIEPIRGQVLSRDMLSALTPPRPVESDDQLLSRMSLGHSVSLMELKLLRAGASRQLIERVQEMRADMEVKRQLLLASRDNPDSELEQLAVRMLRMAEATAREIKQSAVANPAYASRPAEAITDRLLANPANLAHCDSQTLFDKDEYLLIGYLGHLSDICRFLWRAP